MSVILSRPQCVKITTNGLAIEFLEQSVSDRNAELKRCPLIMLIASLSCNKREAGKKSFEVPARLSSLHFG